MAPAKKKAPAKKPAAKKKAPAKKVVTKAVKKIAPKKVVKKTATKKPAAKRTPNAAFMKKMTPSAALAAIVGSAPLARSTMTQKVWAYIKEKNLQDPVNKREIIADAKLKPVFGTAKLNMFKMTAVLSKHLS